MAKRNEGHLDQLLDELTNNATTEELLSDGPASGLASARSSIISKAVASLRMGQ